MEHTENPELSRIVSLERIGIATLEYHIKSSEEELEKLAKRLNLIALPSLTATWMLNRGKKKGTYEIHGQLIADVVQSCSVTLVDFPTRLEVPIHVLLCPTKDYDPEMNNTDTYDVEPIADEIIDLGELTTQYLSLSLDPYPRAPTAEPFKAIYPQDSSDDLVKNPFSILQGLQNHLKTSN